jgi:hypothetical protein
VSYIRDTVIQHVRECHEAGNQARGDELGQEEPRLSVSQIGHCPRMAILDAVRYHPHHPLHAAPTHDFDDYVLEIMEAGNVWERQTGKALARRFGDRVHWQRGDPELRVRNGCWSGHIDFLIEPCEAYTGGAIVEHKATNPVNFQRKDRLPYPFHCLQVLMYAELLRQKRGLSRAMPTYLYYRSWSNWAELQVWRDDGYTMWEGEMNGKHKSGTIELDLGEQAGVIEHYWQAQTLPPRYDTPVQVQFSCARARGGDVYPDCRYFGACWPELEQEGPIAWTG